MESLKVQMAWLNRRIEVEEKYLKEEVEDIRKMVARADSYELVTFVPSKIERVKENRATIQSLYETLSVLESLQEDSKK